MCAMRAAQLRCCRPPGPAVPVPTPGFRLDRHCGNQPRMYRCCAGCRVPPNAAHRIQGDRRKCTRCESHSPVASSVPTSTEVICGVAAPHARRARDKGRWVMLTRRRRSTVSRRALRLAQSGETRFFEGAWARHCCCHHRRYPRQPTTTSVCLIRIQNRVHRPTSFHSNFEVFDAHSIRQESCFRSPLGSEARVNWVHCRDVGRVSAALLARGGGGGGGDDVKRGEVHEVVEVTGPMDSTLSAPEMAALISDVLGRTITYEEVPPPPASTAPDAGG
jgi:hypothetical protein